MQVAGLAVACEIKFQLRVVIRADFLKRLVSAHAHVFHIGVLVEMRHQAEPRFARGGAVGFRVEPAALHAGNHREGEHARARSFRPRLRLIQELMPESVHALIFQQ